MGRVTLLQAFHNRQGPGTLSTRACNAMPALSLTAFSTDEKWGTASVGQ